MSFKYIFIFILFKMFINIKPYPSNLFKLQSEYKKVKIILTLFIEGI